MLCVKNVRVLFVVVAIKFSEAAAVLPYNCYMQRDSPTEMQDGVLGETCTFPWLGLLKVYIRDEGSTITALTGIVMVTHRHALVSVDDVAKMPLRIFHNSTEAMFIPVTGKPLYYRLLNYTAHPEYKNPTINSFGLITLAPHAQGAKLPPPVCWNQEPFNNLDHLYVVGFSDEYELVEKFIHKVEAIDLDTCNYFYNDEGLNEVKRIPIHYQCVSTVILKKTCVWDTGMALVSNSTGYWVLVGFGVYGPGCSVPARFIELLPYEKWIQSVVGPQISFSKGGRNRRRQRNQIQGYELIEEYKMNYPFDTESYSKSYAFYNISRISAQKAIITINTKTKNTSDCVDLIYSERSKIVTPYDIGERTLRTGTATYKLSLYNLLFENISCIEISLVAKSHKNAYLYIEDSIKHTDGAALTDWDEIPKDLLQGYLNTANKHPRTEPSFIERPNDIEFIKNYNLFMRFQFEGDASFVIKVYGTLSKPQIMKTYHDEREHTNFSPGYVEWGSTALGKGISTKMALTSEEVVATVGTTSAASYAAVIAAIVNAEIGLHAHVTFMKNLEYNDPHIINSTNAKIRGYKRFYFNRVIVPNLIHKYAMEAKSIGETIKTKSLIVKGTGTSDHARCTGGCYIDVNTTTEVQVTVNTRPTFTTTNAVSVSETVSQYITTPFSLPVPIPYIIEFNEWCFIQNIEKDSYCFPGEDGYDDDNLPPFLWSKTPTP